MIFTFNKVQMCVNKVLIDCNLGTNTDYTLSEEECFALSNLERVFQSVKLAVEVLCRRDTELITAATTLRSVIRKLEEIKTPIAQKLIIYMRARIAQRRTSGALLYLKDPAQYEEELLAHDDTFKLPSKYLIKKEINNLIERLYGKDNNNLFS